MFLEEKLVSQTQAMTYYDDNLVSNLGPTLKLMGSSTAPALFNF